MSGALAALELRGRVGWMSSDLDLVSPEMVAAQMWWRRRWMPSPVSYPAARLRAYLVPGNKYQVPLRYTDSKRKWFVQGQIMTLEKV